MPTRMLDVLGARTRLIERGDGPPLLLLHGNPDTAELWSGVIEQLKSAHRCYAPDLPGFGASALPAGFDMSMESAAAWIDALLDAAGIGGQVDLAVHDVGGPYGLAWAVAHPARVRRLVIFNTVFFGDFRWHFWARVWRTPMLGELTMKLMNERMFIREIQRGSRRLSTAQIRGMYANFTPAVRAAVLRFYRATDPQKLGDGEARLLQLTARVPTRVLWGAHDPYIPQRFASRFGTEDVQLFADCGHWLPAEAPEAVAAKMAEFLPGAGA